MVRVKIRHLQVARKYVEYITYSKCLYYGRYILSPLIKCQGDPIGIVMRRALLAEIGDVLDV